MKRRKIVTVVIVAIVSIIGSIGFVQQSFARFGTGCIKSDKANLIISLPTKSTPLKLVDFVESVYDVDGNSIDPSVVELPKVAKKLRNDGTYDYYPIEEFLNADGEIIKTLDCFELTFSYTYRDCIDSAGFPTSSQKNSIEGNLGKIEKSILFGQFR
ncbi:hypothetical protein ACYSNW_12655 [Enterococcus sp. LJL99]